jgi:GTP-binding protein
MKPIIAIVGRPNVGKSSLFNKLTRSRDALVADEPGLTRDRLYGTGTIDHREYVLIDTGGLVDEKGGITERVSQQSLQAAREADGILFVVDGREGLSSLDEDIAGHLRCLEKPIVVAVNKAEGLQPDSAVSEFFKLGLGTPQAISCAHNHGLYSLVDTLLDALPHAPETPAEEESGPKIAVIGRPNVGKSTLVNRMLGEERVIVFDQPGTTRDSIVIPFERDQQPYTLIDTAGVRRRARVSDRIEKFSVIKTLQAIEKANVVIVVIDASESVTEQDASLLGMVLENGRALIIAVNKWDGLDPDHKQFIKNEVDRRLHFIDFARIHFISALHGSGVGELFQSIDEAYHSAFVKVPTAALNVILEAAVRAYPPPVVNGRRIKLRYAHLGGHNPPKILIHGNQTDAVPASYSRYLERQFRTRLRLAGTPLRIEFRQTENPYEGKKNRLTPRQVEKRKRLMRYAKNKR